MIKKPPENFQRYFYQFIQIYECLHKPTLSQVLSIQCEDTVPDLKDLGQTGGALQRERTAINQRLGRAVGKGKLFLGYLSFAAADTKSPP